MDFHGVPGKDPNLANQASQPQSFNYPQSRSGSTGALPDEMMEIILATLDDESLQKTAAVDQFLNEKTISAVKHREVSSITQEVQLLVKELDAMIKNTADETLKISCEHAKKELLKATIGSKIGDSQNLIQIKRSLRETRNAIIKAFINLDENTRNRLESSVSQLKRSIVLRTLFPFLNLLKTHPGPELLERYENFKSQGKLSPLEIFIPDLLSVVDVLDQPSAIRVKQFLLMLAGDQHPKLVYLISETLPLSQEMDEVRIQASKILFFSGMIDEAIFVGNKIVSPKNCLQIMFFLVNGLFGKFKFSKALQIAESFKGKPKIAAGELSSEPSSDLYAACFYGYLRHKSYYPAVKLLPSISFENGQRSECEATLTRNLLMDNKSPCAEYLQFLYKSLKIDQQQVSAIIPSLNRLQKLIVNRAIDLSLDEIQRLEDAVPPDFRTEFFIGIFAFARLLKTHNPDEVNQILEPLKKYCQHSQADILYIHRDIKDPEIKKQVGYWIAIQFANAREKNLVNEALTIIEDIIAIESDERKREFYIGEYLQIGSTYYDPEHELMKKFLRKNKLNK